MSKRYSGKSFKDSSVMKKAKLTLKQKRNLKRNKAKQSETKRNKPKQNKTKQNKKKTKRAHTHTHAQ